MKRLWVLIIGFAGRAAVGMVVICAFAGLARADSLYQFSVTDLSGTINSFSFSFTVPTFVASGDTPAFSPFSVTDGTHTWTMVNDLASNLSGFGCFEFGSSGSSFFNPIAGCQVGVPSSPDGGFILGMPGLVPLPTAPGVYSLFGNGSLDFPGGFVMPTFSATLDVTSIVPTPEPSSLLLLGTGFLSVMGMMLLRKPRPA